MSVTIPAHRMQLSAVAPKAYGGMFRFNRSIEFDRVVGELVRVRASQINRCAFCLDMHWKDARAAGETEERLYMIPAWRESPLYNERERAALALCEAMTLISQEGVSDGVWDAAAAQFEEEELAGLVFTITAINAWNRLMIASQTEPGHYQPGAFAD
jgi:AhpD family alkylhydroperoxidase